MQKCINCMMPFKWSHIYKSVMWGYKPIKCGNCGSILNITPPSRLIVAALSVAPIVLLASLSLTPFNNFFLTILFGITIAVTFTLLIPYLVRYSSD